MAFGLVSTNTTSDYKSLNSRRKIFLQYPSGAAPLMGLLSMLPSEDTDKPEFGWFERRFPTQRTATPAASIPFANDDNSAFADGGTMVMNTEYRVNVQSTEQFKPTHVIEIRNLAGGGATGISLKGTVTRVVSSTALIFRPYNDQQLDNASNKNNSKTVIIIGTANQENARSGVGIVTFPSNPTNFTQIFRSAFNISRTALKGGLKYDSSGPYKTLAWDNGLRHCIEMEKAFLFGQKHVVNVQDPETQDSTPETKTGGILWFLQQWEAANSIYRGGTGASALTLNSDPDKRIISLGGTLSKSDYNTYVDRAFKYTNSRAYEKLVLCGGKFLSTVNSLFERDVVRQTALQEKGRNWEFIVHSHTTLRGTLHYKVHPLMDSDPDLEASAFILDLGNMRFRPLSDSDTTFLKGRQETDRDGRKDEWITEAGLEVQFPESCMFLSGANAPS